MLGVKLNEKGAGVHVVGARVGVRVVACLKGVEIGGVSQGCRDRCVGVAVCCGCVLWVCVQGLCAACQQLQ